MSKQHRANHMGIEFNSTSKLQEKLLAEITNLERELHHMNMSGEVADFSLQQTYKEMIHCRREMLNTLPRI